MTDTPNAPRYLYGEQVTIRLHCASPRTEQGLSPSFWLRSRSKPKEKLWTNSETSKRSTAQN